MLRELINKVREPICIHQYNFIKAQDSEDFKRGKMGTVSYYKCEKCGKEKSEYKNNSDINNDFWDF
ncbi:hypothetical protein [Bacillus proteolyticus]|uniref:hypothetical protein n=1 Tax=Bacillus proteolyticus TaxID=2026192 RepID=UPI003CFEA75C